MVGSEFRKRHSGDAGRRDAILDILEDKNWLRGIVIDSADLRHFALPPETDLTEARFHRAVILIDSAIAPIFEQAQAQSSSLRAAGRFPLANFSQATLTGGTELVGDMCLAYFGHADLTGAVLAIDFRGVSFQGANLTGATIVLHPDSIVQALRGADFRGANVAQIRLSPPQTQYSRPDSAFTAYLLERGAVVVESPAEWADIHSRNLRSGWRDAGRSTHLLLVQQVRSRWDPGPWWSRRPLPAWAADRDICDVPRDSTLLWAGVPRR